MALKALVTGAIAEPTLRWTPQQKAVLEMRVNATASNRDKETGRWADIGAPLWVSATFWDDEAQHLSNVLTKGDRVTVEGTLVVETYHRRDGGEGIRYVMRFPRFLGVIPSRRHGGEETYQNPNVAATQAGAGVSYASAQPDFGSTPESEYSPF